MWGDRYWAGRYWPGRYWPYFVSAAGPVSGSLTSTLGGLTSTATGAVALSGTLGATIGLIGIDATGEVETEAPLRRGGGKYVYVKEPDKDKSKPPMEGFDLREYDTTTGKRKPPPAPESTPPPPDTSPPLAAAVSNVVALVPKSKPPEVAPWEETEAYALDRQSDTNLRLILLIAA